jgi:transcriptional regulator with XRE-family HTH domain
MWAEQARHRSGLAAIRSVVGLTQTELAEALGVSQSAVAQIEAKPDLMASTLIRNLAVLNASVIVRFSDATEVALSEVLAAGPAPDEDLQPA